MEKKFKIILDNPMGKQEEVRNKIKSCLKNQSDPMMARIMIFLYEYDVCSMTELTDLLGDYLKRPLDRSNVYKYVHSLVNWGLVSFYDFGFVLNSNKNSQIFNKIKEKHQKFVSKIPSQFQKKFMNAKYYYVTEYGTEFIEWSAKCLNLKVEPNDN